MKTVESYNQGKTILAEHKGQFFLCLEEWNQELRVEISEIESLEVRKNKCFIPRKVISYQAYAIYPNGNYDRVSIPAIELLERFRGMALERDKLNTYGVLTR